MWAPPVTEHPAHLSTILDVIDKCTKILAVVIGGGWAYLNYVRGRTFKRRMEPSISGKTIRSKGVLLLSGLARLKNVGLSKVPIQQRGTAVEVLSYVVATTKADTARLTQKTIVVREIFKVHGWIEPGEEIEETFLLTVPEVDDAVAFGLSLRVVSEHIEWNANSIAEIVPKSDPLVLASESIFFPRHKVQPDIMIQNYENKPRTEEIEQKKQKE